MVLPWLIPVAAAVAGGLASSAGSKLFGGSPEKRKNVSSLLPEQQDLYRQLQGAVTRPGSGGAFGQSADYYRGLLGDENADIDAFSAPQMRQYYQDIVPNISEQFAGGGGGQGSFSSSGFRNAQVQGGVDLAERLGALRANLRNSGAQGLANLGSLGLQNFSQNMATRQGSPGLLSSIAPGIGQGLGAGIGNWFKNSFGGDNVGANSAPVAPNASPQNLPPPTA